MLKMNMNDPDEPSSMRPPTGNVKVANGGEHPEKSPQKGLWSRVKKMLSRPKNCAEELREAIEEFIEESHEQENAEPSVSVHEKSLISNILKLRDSIVTDVMIPRADITAVDVETEQDAFMQLITEKQFSRFPVYRENLDDVLGTVHIKDVFSCIANKQPFNLKDMVRPVPIVSPSIPALDLLLKMQKEKKHMVLVVDEHGGIDGLATIGDVIESIVGEFEDEFDQHSQPQMIERSDGSLIVDARFDIEDFEEKIGSILTEDEREEVETVGGLVFYIANRIPARGEVIQHDSGLRFEVMDADQRRIQTLKVRHFPKSA